MDNNIQFSQKTQIIGGLVLLVLAFAVGRYMTPEKIRIEVKTVEVEKKTTDTDTNRDKHKKTTTVEITRPDGTKEKTTTITEDTETDRKTHSTDDLTKTSDTVKEITNSSSKVTVSALGAMDITKAGLPIYGASITKPVLGPITVGAFGLQNGIAGVSIGLTF